MEILFIGQFVSQEASMIDNRISQAGNNYQLKLVELLSPNLAVSIVPIFFRRNDLHSTPLREVVMINSKTRLPTKLHYIYRLLCDTFKVVRLIGKSKINNVFFYNIDKHNLLMIFITKFLQKKNTFVIVADHSTFSEKTWSDRISNTVLKKIDGALVFNSNIRVNANQIVFPGLLKEDQIVTPSPSHVIQKSVLFSGSLGKTTGLELALETFSERSDFVLYITGRPYKYSESEFEALISKYTQSYNNIKYLGLLDYEEYIEVLNKCDITLSLRDPQDEEHQYNFPSKILEYLSKSKLVISSIVYKDLPEAYLFSCSFDKDNLHRTLDYICTLNKDEVYELKLKIFNYISSNFTSSTLKRVCKELIEGKQYV